MRVRSGANKVDEMNDKVYDVPIAEVAGILDKSDRQVRRYVKGERLTARPVRIDGHIKLMFCRDEVLAFRDGAAAQGVFGRAGREVVADTRLVDGASEASEQETGASAADAQDVGESAAVKYVIDTLGEQIKELQKENRELHYQLEQRSGQVGFLQGKVETLEEEMKMLMPSAESQEEIVRKKPWYKRVFGRE